MGYPIEKIGTDTKLFSMIGSGAIELKHDTLFNQVFQEKDLDCKMMPLNIRQDDLGFFLHGLKDSKIAGVFFESEYWEIVYDLLQEGDEEVRFSGICDTIDIVDNQYRVHLTQGKALLNILKEKIGTVENKCVAIAGSSPTAKSFLYRLIKEKPKKIILADETVENLLDMSSMIDENIVSDIVRLQQNSFDEASDILINFTGTAIDAAQSDDVFNVSLNGEIYKEILSNIAKIKVNEWSN